MIEQRGKVFKEFPLTSSALGVIIYSCVYACVKCRIKSYLTLVTALCVMSVMMYFRRRLTLVNLDFSFSFS